MNRTFSFSQGEYYHVFNRGIDKRDIFNSDEDKVRFQKLLYLCNGDRAVDLRNIPYGSAYDFPVGERLTSVGAYALMDNHFHLLLKEIKEGAISLFMQKLGTSHTKFFNLRNDRTGRLYEGTFKAVHVQDDNHLKRLFSYIHLNPTALLSELTGRDVGKNHEYTLRELKNFTFSSYQDHLDAVRLESKILKLKDFPKYFSSISDYEDDMTDWLHNGS
ncbi:MAG TPA: transposase [Candidatus Paceibacterota bacterium]